MALIVGFPNLAAAAKPTVADLNAAAVKIVEQVGGVDGDGVLHPGNLDFANFPNALFRNAQKSEPYAPFSISVGTLLPDAADAQARALGQSAGPFPFDVLLCGATLVAEGAGAVLAVAGLRFFMDDQAVAAVGPDGTFAWDASLFVPAGALLRVESFDVTYEAGVATEIRATLWFKALHREA
jgi:hypothetical protein